jgi:hypothetical protein
MPVSMMGHCHEAHDLENRSDVGTSQEPWSRLFFYTGVGSAQNGGFLA